METTDLGIVLGLYWDNGKRKWKLRFIDCFCSILFGGYYGTQYRV